MADQVFTDKDFKEKVLESKTPVVVDFWAPWCGPCRMMEPIFDELKKEFDGKVDFVEINVDEEGAVAQKYGVMGIPTYILEKDGKEVGRKVGYTAKPEMVKLLQS